MNRESFFQLFGAGAFYYKSVCFAEPEEKLIVFTWKQINLCLDDLDYSNSLPSHSYSGYNEAGKEDRLDFPVSMNAFKVEFPFDLRRFKKHYLNMFGEHMLAHEILSAMGKYYGDRILLEAVYDQDYIELAFLVEAKHKRCKSPKAY